MKTKIIGIIAFLLLASGCKKDFLTRLPQDEFTDETYWTSEDKVRTFAYGFYTAYFPGYAAGFDLGWGGFFSGQALNDDFAPTSPSSFVSIVPPNDGGWAFSWIRKANIMIDRIQGVPMDEEAKNNWTGIGRFFRAEEYAYLVRRFGDVPWYDKALEENDPELYRPRDPRTFVMDKVLEDFKFAVENVRESDAAVGPDGLIVNRDVILAVMSRVFLFEGTYLKYHDLDQAKATEYLTEAKWAANELISGGKYQVADDYRGLFSSVDLSGNPEIIMYRQYNTAQVTHSLMSYVNREGQTGVSKDLIDTYLAKDGLPIGVSDLYQGDKSFQDVMTDRDPRMYDTFVQELRLNGEVTNPSTSGYSVHKFLNEALKDSPEGLSNQNITDAPEIRYGEVLMNYIEATAELGTVTQNDLDISINALRNRADVKLPALEVIGGKPAVGGQVYDDPKRDPTVDPLLWEIRRERRIELAMEGFRYDDLRRWKKLEYADNGTRPDINRGAWIKKSEHPKMANVVIEGGGDEGYIRPAAPQAYRIFDNPRVYLYPLPLDQIKLYKDNGVELTQNPGW